jgi:hypothetical protein
MSSCCEAAGLGAMRAINVQDSATALVLYRICRWLRMSITPAGADPDIVAFLESSIGRPPSRK